MSADLASSPTENVFGNMTNSEVADNSAEVGANSAEVAANTAPGNSAEVAANTAPGNSAEVAANNTAPANTAPGNSAEVAANTAPANSEEEELASSMNQAPMNQAPMTEAPMNQEPMKPAATMKTKKPMSATARSVLDDRMKTLHELQAAYTNAFGNAPKAPKAKAYEAFALHKIRKEKGENAYQEKMQEYIQRNQGKFTSMPAKKSKTVKFPNNSKNSTQKNSTIEEMGKSAKLLIDSIVSLARKNGAPTNGAPTNGEAKKHRKTRSNKGKTHTHKTVNKSNNS